MLLFLSRTSIAVPTMIDLPIDLNDAPSKTYCVTNSYLKSNGAENQCQDGWSFWQHKVGQHKNFNNSLASIYKYSPNDIYAWDINLNQPTHNTDKEKKVYAVADGEIYIGYEWGLSGHNQVLLEHTDSDGNWSTAYLHMQPLTSKVQQCHDAKGDRDSCLVKKYMYFTKKSSRCRLSK